LLSSWTIHFDTVYATQDKADDARVGVKSTARLFGDHVRAVTSCFAGALVLCLFISGILTGRGPIFFAISCVGTAIHFFWQMYGWNVDDRTQAARIFKVQYEILMMIHRDPNNTVSQSNGDLGYITFAGMALDSYLMRR
jgi:4-hydroxybenzoate polyprenyltransferase